MYTQRSVVRLQVRNAIEDRSVWQHISLNERFHRVRRVSSCKLVTGSVGLHDHLTLVVSL